MSQSFAAALESARAAHSFSLAAASVAASITVVIAFAAFMIVGAGITTTATWMFALGLLAAGGTYLGTFLGVRGKMRKVPDTRAAAAQV
ncbi:hypothetical protein NLM24_42300 [Nocardia zapadnayensis]|nr:hypothetical protein [Nocardia zapadnayensis]MCX0277130.1 hypothetical protein [Nocardia zapadnayensis]